jgi:polyribonucleotide 5'-hydroxyl-kinase
LITTVALQRFWEYRFEVPVSSSLTIRMLSGFAEKDGTELAPNVAYTFSGTKSKINTWHGCTLEINATNAGTYDAYTAELTEETPLVSYLNLHMKLEGLRAAAAAKGVATGMGPRLMVVGPPSSGKTSLVRTLTAWTTRMGRQPLVVNTDPAQGMLSLPGTLSAAIFATLADITTEWGGTPSSGPSTTPVKLPLAYYYGLERPEHNPPQFRSLLSRLAAAATSRLSEDPEVRRTGMLIDTGAANPEAGSGDASSTEQYYEVLAHIVSEFSVNFIITLGSEPIAAELTRRLAGQRTSLSEDIIVLGLEKSGGVAERDAAFMQRVRESAIKEYFFGDAKRTLSPGTQNIAFESVTAWKVGEGKSCLHSPIQSP